MHSPLQTPAYWICFSGTVALLIGALFSTTDVTADPTIPIDQPSTIRTSAA